jgi:hypothetical protein
MWIRGDENMRRRRRNNSRSRHTFFHEWEARDRELSPCPISQPKEDLLIDVDLLDFYQKGKSLRGDTLLL